MKDDFDDIFEALNWEMCKLSGGNPWVFDELVKTRNAKREMQNKSSRTLE